jgi:hypothetical protein
MQDCATSVFYECVSQIHDLMLQSPNIFLSNKEYEMSFCYCRFTITYATNLTFVMIKVCFLISFYIYIRWINQVVVGCSCITKPYLVACGWCRVAAMLLLKQILKNHLLWLKGGWIMSPCSPDAPIYTSACCIEFRFIIHRARIRVGMIIWNHWM